MVVDGVYKDKALVLTPRVLELLFILLVAWMIAGWIMVESDSKRLPKVIPVLTSESEDRSFDIKVFQQINLFGKLNVKSDKVTESKQPVVASRLNIKLIGTVVAGKKSAAMLTVDGSRKQLVVFLKEKIQPNVTLEEVFVAEIVVDNNGKHERISIEKGKVILNASTSSPRKRNVTRPLATAQLNKRINRNKLQAQMRNFSTLLSQARVTPHFTNKKADGFMISEIVKGSLYEEIGLQNGDIIKKVNGESVTGAEQAMRMYRELQSATFIDVEVERAGTLQQISYVIQ